METMSITVPRLESQILTLVSRMDLVIPCISKASFLKVPRADSWHTLESVGARYTVAAIMSLLRTFIPGEIGWVFLNLSWNIPLLCVQGGLPSIQWAVCQVWVILQCHQICINVSRGSGPSSAGNTLRKSRLLAACSIFVTPPTCHPKPFLPCQFSRKSTFYGLGLSREHLLRTRHLSLTPSCPSASSSEESHGPLSKWQVLTAAAL